MTSVFYSGNVGANSFIQHEDVVSKFVVRLNLLNVRNLRSHISSHGDIVCLIILTFVTQTSITNSRFGEFSIELKFIFICLTSELCSDPDIDSSGVQHLRLSVTLLI